MGGPPPLEVGEPMTKPGFTRLLTEPRPLGCGHGRTVTRFRWNALEDWEHRWPDDPARSGVAMSIAEDFGQLIFQPTMPRYEPRPSASGPRTISERPANQHPTRTRPHTSFRRKP